MTFKVGDFVKVLNCPEHRGQVGEVIDTYADQLRIGFDNGTRCWPSAGTVVPADKPGESAA